MRRYDPDIPLIFMHIPKTGGNAVKHVIIRWFGRSKYIRPYREGLETLEGDPRIGEGPVCLGGHWPTHKKVLERVCPEVENRQIFTVVRDLFSMVKSMYTYGLQREGDTGAKRAGSFNAYLDGLHARRAGLSIFSYLPKPAENYSLETYAQQFMLVGITEDLKSSMTHLGEAIGKPAPDDVPFRNKSLIRPSDVTEDRREEIEALYPREVEFYHAARAALENGRPLGWVKSGRS